MINRRTALGIIASASTIGASGVALAKEKSHFDGKALLGDKIKQNGKHKIHKVGNIDVFAEVNNGKVVGVSRLLGLRPCVRLLLLVSGGSRNR